MSQRPKPYKFGIALSGGGARGILHLGVLEALHKYGIHPEIISGNSGRANISILAVVGGRIYVGSDFEPSHFRAD